MFALATGRVRAALKRLRGARSADNLAALREAWAWRRAWQGGVA